MSGTTRRGRGVRAGLAAAGATMLAAFVVGAGSASAQAEPESARPSAASEAPDLRTELALERGGLAGFEALTALAGELTARIRDDTRTLVDAGGEALASVADVTLKLGLGEGLTDAGSDVRLESVRLDMGRTVTLAPSALRALERGEVVTAYAGTLPSALGAVGVRAEGSAGTESRLLDGAVRLAIAPGHRAVIRIELVRDPGGGWGLNPLLEDAEVAGGADPNADDPEERSP